MVCRICGLSFILEDFHYALGHSDQKENRCMFCAKLFNTVHSMFNHITEHDGTVYCCLCGNVYDDYSLLMDHIDCHEEMHVYGCKNCQWTTANLLKYLDHICTDEISNESNAKIKKIVENNGDIKVNENDEGPTNSTTKKEIKYDRTTIKSLSVKGKSNSIYNCSTCTKVFKTARGLRYHSHKHDDSLSEICHICDRKFPVHCKLKTHMKTHDITRSYPCSECNNVYKSKYTLKIHLLKHQGGMKCWNCELKFFRKYQIKKHLTIYTCCGETLGCKTLYRKHLTNIAHSLQCEFCTLRFGTDVALKYHMSITHREKVATHKCSCGLLVRSSHNLARHKRRLCQKWKK